MGAPLHDVPGAPNAGTLVRCVGVPPIRIGAAPSMGGTSMHTFGHGAMAG